MAGTYIQVLDDDEQFSWSPDTGDGEKSASEFTLRTVPEDVLKRLRKVHTHRTFKHGQQVEDFDAFSYVADVLDYAIVTWAGVLRSKTREDLPCTKANKVRLPERIKTEIMRLCAGKEAGSALDDEGDDPKKS